MKNLRLTPELRKELKKPLGKVIDEDGLRDLDESKVISVGDVVTLKLLELGKVPWISVVDFRIKRKALDEEVRKKLKYRASVLKTFNPPGFITQELMNSFEKALNKEGKIRIEVFGEEDLSALVAMLLAPPGSVVLYGQPDEGIVRVDVDEKVREMAKEIMGRMEEIEWK